MAIRKQRISPAMRREVASRFGATRGSTTEITCSYCPEPITITWDGETDRVRFLDAEGRSTPELDHIQPLFLGGPHAVDNLQPACLRCNRSKGRKRLVEDE